MQFDGFRKVSYLRLFLISFSITCFVLCHCRSLLMAIVQWILRKLLLNNTLNFDNGCDSSLSFNSVQWNHLSLVSKTLPLFFMDSSFEFQIFSYCKNVALALPIRASTSASSHLCLSMMLSRHMKASTSSHEV